MGDLLSRILTIDRCYFFFFFCFARFCFQTFILASSVTAMSSAREGNSQLKYPFEAFLYFMYATTKVQQEGQ